MSLVLPGDSVPVPSTGTLTLGPGLLQLPGSSSRDVVATKEGFLNRTANGTGFWVESNSHRYVPAAQEGVIGIVTARLGGGEAYRIDIGSAHPAQLDGLAFEGATKRNRPNLKVGALVYARVSLAHKDMEPELECFDAQTRKAADFGELKGGLLVKCSLGLCRLLLDTGHFLLTILLSNFPDMEVVVGTNGRVWIKADEAKKIIAIARCIEAADPRGAAMDQTQIQGYLREIMA